MIRDAIDWAVFLCGAAKELGVWGLIAASIMLEGCAITGTQNGVERSFGVFPVAAPEPKTVTLDQAKVVAADVELAGYGHILFGYQSLTRLRVPVLCLEDGRCFVPMVQTKTQAQTSFRGGTAVADGLTVGGFAPIAPDEPIHLELGLEPPAVPVAP